MIETALQNGSIRELFIEHLGWDSARGTERVEVDGQVVELVRVAHKRGFSVFEHRAERRLVQARRYIKALSIQASRIAHENVLIVADERAAVQVWVWSRHDAETGRRRHRMHPFFADRIPPAVIERITKLTVTLEEEEHVSLPDVSARTTTALDATADQDVFFRRPEYARLSDELARRMREGGDAAFHNFVMFHHRLATWFAKRYKRMPVDPEDMAQVAMFGLIRASRFFDPDRGTAFSTYAFSAMRNECNRYLPTAVLLIRVPPYTYFPYRRIIRRMERAWRSSGPEAARQEYAKAIEEEGFSLSVADDLHRAFHVQSLQALKRHEWDRRAASADFQHALADTTEHRTPLGDAISQELRGVLLDEIDSLEEGNRAIIRRRFGIDCEGETLQQIGDDLGLTRERVRQREVAALNDLRRLVCERLGVVLPKPAKRTADAAGEKPPPAKRRVVVVKV